MANSVFMLAEGSVMTVRKLFLMHRMSPKSCSVCVQVLLHIRFGVENGSVCTNSLGNEK